MHSSSSWADGWRRVAAAPALLAAVFLMTLLAALPLAITLRDSLQAHLGASLMADEAADGANWDWWQEYTSQASGLGTTFTPSVIGFAATLDNISSVLGAQAEIAPISAALAVYLGGWLFLTGGVIDRYARQRRTRAFGFFGAAGAMFPRLLRLGVIAAILYWVLFTYAHEWLFGEAYVRMTRDIDVERRAFAWRAGLYTLFGALLVLVNVVFDYAKVRLVVEDRRSAIGALLASLAFIGRNARAVAGLYALNALTFAAVLGAWALLAPGAGRSGVRMWLTALATQLFILARLAVKLQFLASATALFQGRLAHARYTAASPPVWPESPAAETIQVPGEACPPPGRLGSGPTVSAPPPRGPSASSAGA